MALRTEYAQRLSADAETAALAGDYLLWFIPAMALQFGLVAMGAALRGTGNFKPGMVVQTATVVLNIVLAPIADLRLGDRAAARRGGRRHRHLHRGRGRRRLACALLRAAPTRTSSST